MPPSALWFGVRLYAFLVRRRVPSNECVEVSGCCPERTWLQMLSIGTRTEHSYPVAHSSPDLSGRTSLSSDAAGSGNLERTKTAPSSRNAATKYAAW